MTGELYDDVKLIHEKLHGGSAYRVSTFYLYLRFHDNYMIMLEKLKNLDNFMLFVEENGSNPCLLFVKTEELITLLACYIREDRYGEFE